MPQSTKMSDGNDPARRVRKWYLIGLCSIAGLTIFGQVMMHDLIVSESDRSHIINIAGRQRMLSQRITKDALSGNLESLREDLETWSEVHYALLDGSEDLDLPPTTDPELRAMYERLHPHFVTMHETARTVLDAETPEQADAAIVALMAAEPIFLSDMNEIAFAKAKIGEEHVALLERLEFAIGSITLLVLLIEAFFIFEPMVRRLSRNWISLIDKENRFRLAVLGSRDAIWDWDLVKGEMYIAPRLAEMLGEHSGVFEGRPEDLFGRIMPQHLDAFNGDVVRVVDDPNHSLDSEIQMSHSDGSKRWMLCRAAEERNEWGEAVRLVGSLADITELKQSQAELQHLADHDPLTGLANRKSFIESLEFTIEGSKHGNSNAFGVLFLDFDRFKLVNDSLGHDVGDELLKSIACRLRDFLPAGATPARFGGDEFAVIVEAQAPSGIVELCDQLLKDLVRPHAVGRHSLVSTASIGVVIGGFCDDLPGEMLRDADTAMYEAKNSGRGRVVLFDSEMRDRVVQREEFERDLRKPSITDEMHLVYHPVVALGNGRVTGFEVLARWRHPVKGELDAKEFIPVAEECGIIVPLGRWVFRQATAQLTRWDEADANRRLNISINVSCKQLLQASFMEMLRDHAEQNPDQVGRIALDVAESAIVDERADITPALRAVRDLGYRVAMDDFGTGKSSLGHLHQYPIDILKVDKSLVQSIDQSREFSAVFAAIIALAHAINLKVIAEGVDSHAQFAHLQAMDCESGQGFFFAEPMTAEMAAAFMHERDQDPEQRAGPISEAA